MKKLYLSLYFLALIGIHSPAGADDQSAALTFKQDELTIHSPGGDHRFAIEVAETNEQMEYGLMFRKTLASDHGMLFLWKQDARIAMWMKNTLIPLDMVFLDSHGKIVQIAANATPESTKTIRARQPVRAVIEMAGGTTAADGIKVGDSVIYSAFNP